MAKTLCYNVVNEQISQVFCYKSKPQSSDILTMLAASKIKIHGYFCTYYKVQTNIDLLYFQRTSNRSTIIRSGHLVANNKTKFLKRQHDRDGI